MLFKAKFPAFVESASVPRYRHPRPVFQVFDTEIDIETVSDDEMPVVLRTHEIVAKGRRGNSMEFRLRADRFFAKTHYVVRDIERHLESPFSRFGPLWYALHAQAVRSRPFAKRTLPKGLTERILSFNDPIWEHYDFFRDIAPHVVIPREAREGIFEAEAAFRQACGSIVLIDGAVWMESPEPLLAVGLRDSPGRVRCLAPNLPKRSPIVHAKRPELDRLLFTFAQHEEAMALAVSMFDPVSPWRARDFVIETLTPGVFSPSPPIGDAIGQLHLCTENQHLPKASLARLRRFLADDTLWTEDLVHVEIEHAMSVLPLYSAPSLVHEMGRYDAKPIDIVDTARSIGANTP